MKKTQDSLAAAYERLHQDYGYLETLHSAAQQQLLETRQQLSDARRMLLEKDMTIWDMQLQLERLKRQ